MCCFSGTVRAVGNTKIFARRARDNRQILVYAMDVDIVTELAMVLPLPVPPRSREDAVSFVDLEGYPTFFDDLDTAFPGLDGPGFLSATKGMLLGAEERPKLVVHDVGRFEASFVPTLADFARLDERFRMPEDTWARLPGYADWGFAVFRLKPVRAASGNATQQTLHPMAFSFPTRAPNAIFFPTVHVHDGTVPARVQFDHRIYCQADGVLGATLGWMRSNGKLSSSVDRKRAKGVIDEDSIGFGSLLYLYLPNRDTWLREPGGVSLEELEGGGPCHAFKVSATHAYVDAADENDERRQWCETASTRLGRLCRGLRRGLAELEAAHRTEWRLAAITDDMPHYGVNGSGMWSNSTGMGVPPDVAQGGGKVTFMPSSEKVEPQQITFGFEHLPDKGLNVEIIYQLGCLLDRAVDGD